jgi:ribosomal protein L11 methyltransferase
MLGAGHCVATDIEEQAVQATRANLALNEVESEIDVLFGSLEAVTSGEFDLVCANINAGTIIRLAADLAKRMRPGAHMLAGGVIADRESPVREALELAGLAVDRVLAEGDWRTLVARKP